MTGASLASLHAQMHRSAVLVQLAMRFVVRDQCCRFVGPHVVKGSASDPHLRQLPGISTLGEASEDVPWVMRCEESAGMLLKL